MDRYGIYHGEAWGAAHPNSLRARRNVLGRTIPPKSQEPAATTYPINIETPSTSTFGDTNPETELLPTPLTVDTAGGTSSFVGDNPEIVVNDGSFENAHFTRDLVSYESKDYFSTYRQVARDNNRATEQIYQVKNFMNQDQFKKRFQGAHGIRGTFKFKVNWNADPMIQGLYIMCYIPEAVTFPTLNRDQLNNFYSQCPHVILNIAREDSAELIVPYVGETAYMPLQPVGLLGDSQAGRLIISPIFQPASSISPVNIYFNLFFALDDCQLFSKHPADAEVQGFFTATAVSEAIRKSQLVSKASGAISKWIDAKPTDGAFKRGVGWVFGGINKIADFLGWSKPFSLRALEPVVAMGYNDMVTSDATFTAAKLASNSDASIGFAPINPTDTDPLSFASMFSQYEYFQNFTVTKNHAPGTLLYTQEVTPDAFYTGEATQKQYRQDTSLAYIARVFKRWRGSLQFKIVPSSTRFHSCRLRIVIGQNPPETASYDRMSFVHTAIVNISDPTTWEVEVPYLAFNPWRSLPTDEYNVVMRIYLENPLVAPENVSDTIQVALFVRAGEDFEFADLTQIQQNQVPFLFVETPKRVNTDAVVQASEAIHKFVESGFDSIAAHQLSVGDPIRSMRSQLKRFCRAQTHDNSQNMALVNIPVHFSYYQPTQAPDLISYISPMFTFFRGSFRYVMLSPNTLVAALSHTNQVIGEFRVNPCYQTNETSNGKLVSVIVPPNEYTKIEIPFFSNFKCVNLWRTMRAGTIRPSKATHVVLDNLGDNTPASIPIYRAVGDDFDLGFRVGVPAVKVPPSS